MKTLNFFCCILDHLIVECGGRGWGRSRSSDLLLTYSQKNFFVFFDIDKCLGLHLLCAINDWMYMKTE